MADQGAEWADKPRPSDPGGSLQLLLAEYQFVSGLIPFYRGVELRALGGTGLVLSGVAAAFAAFEAADTPNVTAEATLLTLAAWIPAFLLLIEIMALTRLRRASLYIAKRLHPLAAQLTQDDRILRWELEPSKALFEKTPTSSQAKPTDSVGRMQSLTEGAMRVFISSSPLIVSIAGVSVALAGAGMIRGGELIFVFIGAPAAIIAIVLGTYGVTFTALHEGRLLGESSKSRLDRRLRRGS